MKTPPRLHELRRLLPALAFMLAATVASSGAMSAGPAAAGPGWNQLTPTQREVLKPLQRDWDGIDAPRKQKWLELAARYPKLSPPEQQRMQERMADWARLTPAQRGEVRQSFQEAKQQAGREERRARWEAYQALPEEERKALASRAAERRAPQDSRLNNRAARTTEQAKSNIVPNPLHTAPPPKPVAPTVVQARPGATTTLMSKRPSPPAHQQTGLPKIAATPEFVDRNTLLPQRGPQGAAVEPVRPRRNSDGGNNGNSNKKN
jgi:hypothetical protein